MIINAQALRALDVSFSTLYNKGFASKEPKYPLVATEVPSSTSEEHYGWIGQMPDMEEWLDERTIKNLSAYTYTIKNKTFESTVAIDREELEDDRYGVYRPNFETMGAKAATAPDRTVFELLQRGFEAKCYDGQPFFSAEHKVAGKIYSNMSTAKLSQESFIAARTAIMSFVGDKGKSLGIVPNMLLVPPALEMTAKKILEADIVNAETNITKGLAKVEVVSELAGDPNAWYLLATNEPLKPLILQMRRRPKFAALTKDTDPNVFFKRQYLYGVDGRWNAGFGFWQMAYGSTGAGTEDSGSEGTGTDDTESAEQAKG